MNKHVETLRKAHEAFSRHKVDEAVQVMAEGGTMVDHGRGKTYHGRADFFNMLSGFVQMSSNIKIVDARYIEAGDWVTAQFRAVGTQDGPMAGTPFGPSHKPFSLDVCEVWRFGADGLALEGHNYSDGFGLLMQLGHLQAPP
ncbi:nuclear transport factor 2 family protein [Meiothermus sp.]|uniref:ester cyclase n=1 Tax=Meiothermus sp. TaxID=1955249 RepID=UPI00307E4B06